MKKSIILLLHLVLFLNTIFTQSSSRNLRIIDDITYKESDNTDINLTLVVPCDSIRSGKLLAILKDEVTKNDSTYYKLARSLAGYGYITAILDFRQPPDYSYPASVEDVIDGLNWLKENGDQYDVQVNAIGLIGQNFAGYLASLIGLDRNDIIQMVTAISSPMDLTKYLPPWGYPYRYHAFVGEPMIKNTEKWQNLSPIFNVKKSGPSFLLLHGENDNRIPIEQSLIMEDELKSALCPVKLIKTDHAVNGYYYDDTNIEQTAKHIADYASHSMYEIPREIELIKDVVYLDINRKKLHLDIFRPINFNKTIPAILLFHGGGWMWGRKELMRNYAVELAKEGFIAVSVEYRLAREALYPACLDDAKAAIRWVKDNAAKYGINKELIGAAGQSAGGHIAAMLGMTNGKEFFSKYLGSKKENADVKAIATLSGVVDMLALYPRDPFSPATLFGESPSTNKDIYIEASPINLVNENSAISLFIHGSEDHLGRSEEMEEITNRLKELNVASETFILEGGGHDFERYQIYFNQASNKLIDFMKNNLGHPY